MQLRPIDIDIDVHRYIEQRRTSFAQMPNDILRLEFGLVSPPVPPGANDKPVEAASASGDWTWKGVTLPAGTELRMTYNGRTHTGTVAGGAWQVGGATYASPSSAADALARSRDGKQVSLNGWRLWEVLKPGARSWVVLDKLRPASTRVTRNTVRKAD